MGQDHEREKRARERRANYPGTVIEAGEDKPALYSDLTLLERLAHQTALVESQAKMSSMELPKIPRSEWPGEIFRLGES
jgi:hypothetical protein